MARTYIQQLVEKQGPLTSVQRVALLRAVYRQANVLQDLMNRLAEDMEDDAVRARTANRMEDAAVQLDAVIDSLPTEKDVR